MPALALFTAELVPLQVHIQWCLQEQIPFSSSCLCKPEFPNMKTTGKLDKYLTNTIHLTNRGHVYGRFFRPALVTLATETKPNPDHELVIGHQVLKWGLEGKPSQVKHTSLTYLNTGSNLLAQHCADLATNSHTSRPSIALAAILVFFVLLKVHFSSQVSRTEHRRYKITL